jgi:hypothetical protein
LRSWPEALPKEYQWAQGAFERVVAALQKHPLIALIIVLGGVIAALNGAFDLNKHVSDWLTRKLPPAEDFNGVTMTPQLAHKNIFPFTVRVEDASRELNTINGECQTQADTSGINSAENISSSQAQFPALSHPGFITVTCPEPFHHELSTWEDPKDSKINSATVVVDLEYAITGVPGRHYSRWTFALGQDRNQIPTWDLLTKDAGPLSKRPPSPARDGR